MPARSLLCPYSAPPPWTPGPGPAGPGGFPAAFDIKSGAPAGQAHSPGEESPIPNKVVNQMNRPRLPLGDYYQLLLRHELVADDTPLAASTLKPGEYAFYGVTGSGGALRAERLP